MPYDTLSVKGDEVPEAMNVPAVTPEKESVWPTARVPDVVTDTVSVVPEMEPVTVAAAVPLVAAALAPEGQIIPVVVIATLVSLAGLGALGAQAGGAPKLRATARVLFWGAAAMAITAGVGRMFGVAV